MIAVALVFACGLLVLGCLTIVGARRRGNGVAPSVLAGVFFPVTWIAWYLRDRAWS
jgi:hypothetical protein